MKIEKLYFIAMGTLLSSNAFSQTDLIDNINHQHSSMDEMNNTESEMLLTEGKIGQTMFVCPMHPEIIQPEMGNCPICGMKLVEKSQNNKVVTNEVVVSQGMQQNLNIKTEKAKMKRITPVFNSYGKISYNEDSIVHTHLRVKGWLESSNILKEGQFVEKGSELFRLYSEELIVAQHDLLLTLKSNNESLNNSAIKRLKLLGVDKKVIDTVIKDKKVMYEVPFYAQASGFIKNFNIREGMYVNPEKELFSIINEDSFWVEGYLYEDNKGLISLDNKIIVKMPENEIYETKVDYIYPELDKTTLSLKYRGTINVKNKKTIMFPNTIVEMKLYSNEKIMGLFVPLESLIQTENENKIVVKQKNGFVVKEVLVGFKNKKYAQILKGLSLNDQVVTSGQFLIDSEASLSGSIIRIGANNE